MALRKWVRLAACALVADVAQAGATDGFLTRPYTGKYMPLGALYNAAAELPVGGLYTPADVIDRHRVVTPTPGLNVRFVKDDTWSSKCKLLNIEAEFAVKVKALDVSGSAAYLSDKQTKRKELRMSFASEATFETESLTAWTPEALAAVRTDAATVATHVVTGVVWGHRTVATFAHSYSADLDTFDFEGELSASLTKLIFTGTLGIGVKLFDDDRYAEESVRSIIYSDGVPDAMPDPTNLTAVVAFVKAAYKTVVNDTVPRGVPLAYHLTALADLRPGSARALVSELDAAALADTQAVIEELDASDLQLSSLAEEDSRGHFLWTARALGHWANFRQYRAELLNDFGKKLTEASYGLDLPETLSIPTLVSRHHEGDFSDAKVSVWVEDHRAEMDSWRQVSAAFEASGVRVADAARDVARAVMGIDADASYLLLLVEGAGGYDRAMIQSFAGLARGKLRDAADPSMGHCTLQADPNMEPVCHDSLQMLAVHFESFCTALCPSRFCFTQRIALETGVRQACPGESANGTCELLKSEACWRRPLPDEERGDGATAVLSEDWCACPSTALVKYHSNGTEDMVEFLAVPDKPVIIDVVMRPSAAPDDQSIDVVFAGAPAGTGARYEIAVVWDCFACGSPSTEAVRTVSVVGNVTTVPIGGLRAGERYRLEVTAINDVGRSLRSETWHDVVVRQAMLSVRAERWVDRDGAKRFFPEGAVDSALPSWRAGGGDGIVVAVAVSSQTERPLHSILFEEVMPFGSQRSPAVVQCEDVVVRTSSSLECRLPYSSLEAADPAAFDADRAFTVSGRDPAGTEVAWGEVRWAAADSRTCALFEGAARLALCEARIRSIAVANTQTDPLSVGVTLSLGVGRFNRTAFQGWMVHVQPLDGGSPFAVRAPPGMEVPVSGLRAGGRYWFTLRAVREDGDLTPATVPYPSAGYRVLENSVIVTPRRLPDGSEAGAWRNRLPGWLMNGDGHQHRLQVAVRLALPAAGAVDRVVFYAAGSDEHEEPCRQYERKTNMGVDCAVWTDRLNRQGVPGLFGERMRVVAFDRYGEALAEGTVLRVGMYARACVEWGHGAPLRCIADSGPDRCVADCSECAAGGATEAFGGDVCERGTCPQGKLFCPGVGTCFDRDAALADGGCSDQCYGAVFGEVAGMAACNPPCEPFPGVTVLPGATATVRCPAGEVQVGAAVSIECPHRNTDRYPHNADLDVAAPWAQGLDLPSCRSCSLDEDCGGRADSAAPNEDQTGCLCACLAGYAGPACEDCASQHFWREGRCQRCTVNTACSGHAYSASMEGGGCRCTCADGFAGAACDRCADDTHPYPLCQT
eukprot:TRINITY_DN3365_c0_g1_i2.p2 TRINITY_DN3365_c0_g1~~TRINITY_DN3365_c0_g1_i2.p2  ORF type:complete len:1323 (+),score=191.11 TRINITY_DN3365_c0_g1_i2:128-4096(+)